MEALSTIARLCSRFLGAAALVAASVSSAAAQAPPTLIQGIYVQSSDTKSLDGVVTNPDCFTQQSCYILFSRVKKNKQLIVTQISCTFPHASANVRFASLSPEAKGTVLFRTHYFVPVPTTADRVGFSSPTLMVFDGGERPVVQVVFDGITSIFGSCTIAGELKDLI